MFVFSVFRTVMLHAFTRGKRGAQAQKSPLLRRQKAGFRGIRGRCSD
ncbi:MAG TPA: hypothetical protein VMJ11_19490 [Paraburkholderia sp.]|nr:hypothetical protein [Paraburkholderia sp.]